MQMRPRKSHILKLIFSIVQNDKGKTSDFIQI
jgi:hypothetical protein